MRPAAKRRRARDLAAAGAALLHTDRTEAERCYREAISLDPDDGGSWFDLGLIYKWARRWEEAFRCNLRAAQLSGKATDEPAWWNLGIAATALHRWDVARRAWAAYGLRVPDGVGPIEANYGDGAVRINPDGDPEIVWGHRIDPARMRLVSIPFPQSGHRWADIVLHDGAPNGYREVDGEEFPVFDELARWQPSDVPTVEVAVSAESDQAIEELGRLVVDAGHAAENWSRSVRMLCRQCSEGVVSGDHETDHARFDSGEEHLIGIAAPVEDARALVSVWAGAPGRTCHRFEATTT